MNIRNVAELIASLGIVDESHVWIGKLDNKSKESVGVYPIRRGGTPRIPIGGLKNTDHDSRRISILIHWNKDMVATESIASDFYSRIRDTKNVTVNGATVKFIQMLVPEAVSVGTDDNGIYEYVIEFEIYYER